MRGSEGLRKNHRGASTHQTDRVAIQNRYDRPAEQHRQRGRIQSLRSGGRFHFTRSPSIPTRRPTILPKCWGRYQCDEEPFRCKVDYATYACTAGSIRPSDRLLGTMTEIGGVPSNSTAQAIVAALNALGRPVLSWHRPTQETNEHEAHYLANHGIEVLATTGLNLNTSLENIQKISRVPPPDVFEHASSIDRPEAEALPICCTDFNTFDRSNR